MGISRIWELWEQCGCLLTNDGVRIACSEGHSYRLIKEESMGEKQEGKKFDDGKPRMDLLPMDALLEVAKVLAMGAKKYGDRNWEKGIDTQRLRAAGLRHDAASEMGEDLDPESGLTHRAHKACDALMELSLYLRAQPELPF